MIDIRPFENLGRFHNEWLDAHYHFSFSEYHDPRRMGFGVLRVWNDDTVRADTGFPPHGHRDMEIITYVRKGAVTHEDGMGNRGRTEAGDVQVMSAGTGVVHAEYNREQEETQLFQIWIQPDRRGAEPRWAQRRFPTRDGRLSVLASGRPGDEDALPINQDAAILGATLRKGDRVSHGLAGRRAYLVPARGRVRVNGIEVPARSGAAVEGEEALEIEALDDAEVVIADLP